MFMKKAALLFILFGALFFSCQGAFDFPGSLWLPENEYRAGDYKRLLKKDGEDFRIIQFTDTHINAYYDDFDTLDLSTHCEAMCSILTLHGQQCPCSNERAASEFHYRDPQTKP
ncbi:MAG: hypothetical protein LBG14_04640 [Treponema sp.]|jgi:hypothetical protein|nr:hypothetical protein [Treponema sp.]